MPQSNSHPNRKYITVSLVIKSIVLAFCPITNAVTVMVAMWGGSYWAATQWRAAIAQPPSLKAIVPGYIDAEHWKYGYRNHGAIHLKMTTQSNRAIPGYKYSFDKWEQMFSFLSLIKMNESSLSNRAIGI